MRNLKIKLIKQIIYLLLKYIKLLKFLDINMNLIQIIKILTMHFLKQQK